MNMMINFRGNIVYYKITIFCDMCCRKTENVLSLQRI